MERLESSVELLGAGEAYYVLKEGRMIGPVGMEALRSGRRDGLFSDTDLVQSGDLPLWQPLIHVVSEVPAMSGVLIPEWKSIATLAGLRLRHNVGQQPLATAIFCLLVGGFVLAISQWSFLFWAPWLVAAGWAGFTLIGQRREVLGTAVLLVVMAIPFSRAWLATQSLKGEMSAALAAAGIKMGEPWISSQPSLPVKAESPSPVTGAMVTPVEVPSAEMVSTGEAKAASSPPPSEPPSGTGPVVASFGSPVVDTPRPAPVTMPPAPVPPWERPAREWEKSPSAPGPETAPAMDVQPDFVQTHTDAFVIVKGVQGSGSGFICRAGNQTWLYSNIHVVAGMDQPVFTLLGNKVVRTGPAEAAAGPDIVRCAMPSGVGQPLELMTGVDANIRIGDAVVVLGNSGGGGVVTSLKGEIRGIGPDRIEVTSEFIPGNSGSPIIHVKSGKVIGIATYLTRRFDEFAPKSDGTPAPRSSGRPEGAMVVRRFGYRLDTVPNWEPINWALFRAEARQMEQVTQLTEDIVGFLGAMRTRSAPQYGTDTLRRPAISWLDRVRSKQISENDRLSATQRFLGQLRSMVRSDVQNAEATLRYTYFRNELKDQQQVRDALYQAFSAESASLTSPSSRPGYR